MRKKDDILKTQFERYFVKADANIITEIKMNFSGEIEHSNILNKAHKSIKLLLDNSSIGEKVNIDLIINHENTRLYIFSNQILHIIVAKDRMSSPNTSLVICTYCGF